ncbi:MAG TPA: serine/threonine-protein kinase [Myxococcaceae bacterium]|nr:serine/threonine-protein kinase [Myxococcaceae bacterium]
MARYARGESAPDEAATVRAHAQGCLKCARKLAQLAGGNTGSDPEHDVDTRPERGPARPSATTRGTPPSATPERATPPPLAFSSEPATEHSARVIQLASADEEDDLSDEGPTEAAASAKPLGRGDILGRFLVLQRIGKGGMGVVYAAYDPELDRKVALKLLRPSDDSDDEQENRARLLREAQAMARVSHPNVMAVFDVGTWEDRVFLAMELVDGVTLGKWHGQKRPWREVIQTYVAAGQGLAAAHKAGLVHRDFKPDNVLVGKDGRVRVTDFGLARQVHQADHDKRPTGEDSEAAVRRKGKDDAITQAGMVIGTPRYMAPEQHLGLPPDARSDQFSFCAALYYALFRQRPFDIDKLRSVAAETLGGKEASPHATRPLSPGKVHRVIQEPPREPKVPPWVRRALMRGLELSPEARFPSMDALLAELSRMPNPARWPIAAAAAAGVALIAGAVGYGELARYRITHAAEARLTGVWDPPMRARAEKAFLATDKPYAQAAWDGARPILDAYASAWLQADVEAARATRSGEQTAQVLALREACLDRRLKELKAITGLFATADAKTVERAMDVVNTLPDLKRCSDTDALQAPLSPPSDPTSRAALEKLTSQVAEIKALSAAGKPIPALELAKTAAEQSKALGYRPMHAEVLYLLGLLQTKDPTEGERTLTEAVWTADAGHHDEVRAQAATRLIYVIGNLQGRVDDIRPWERAAYAVLDRLGPGYEEREADLLGALGSVYLHARKNAQAQEPLERAKRIYERVLGEGHPKRGAVMNSLGVLYTYQGRYEPARQILEESLAVIERTRGPSHPSAAYPLNSLSEALIEQGDYAAALEHQQKALVIREAALGPDHPMVGDLHDWIATTLGKQGRHSDALDHYRRALEIKVRALGDKHPDLIYSLDGIGQAYVGMGRPQEAIPYLERGLALGSEDPVIIADTRYDLARALWEAHRDRPRALSLMQQAKQGYETAGAKQKLEQTRAWMATNGR